jgi:aminoglycoside/choline kinase family phosphotransferase
VNATALREETRRTFLKDAGWGAAEAKPLPGDASTRRYIRLHMGSRTALLMDQPQNGETPTASSSATPAERRALGYNALARLAGSDCVRFMAAARYLRRAGIAAPDIYSADAAQGLLLIEDLGNDLYTDVLGSSGSDETTLYAAAIDALVRLHSDRAPATLAPGIPLFAYDETALIAETDLLMEWFLPAALDRAASDGEASEHRALWRAAIRLVCGGSVFVHRDYHAQNLLWRGDRSGLARVGVIDFQDAVAGAPAYDIISLLEDARRDVAPELAHAMTERYIAAAAADPLRFRTSAAVLAAQRNAKIIGIFARLANRDKKPRYLAHLARVWRYMEGDLAHPELRQLKAWYDRVVPKEARGALKFPGEAA